MRCRQTQSLLGNACLFIYDHCDQFNDFVCTVCNAVTCVGRTDGDITGSNGFDGAVVAVLRCALEDIEELRITFVHVIADAAAGIQGDFGEQSAFAAELIGAGNKMECSFIIRCYAKKWYRMCLRGRNFSWKREHDTIVCSCTCGQGRMPAVRHV